MRKQRKIFAGGGAAIAPYDWGLKPGVADQFGYIDPSRTMQSIGSVTGTTPSYASVARRTMAPVQGPGPTMTGTTRPMTSTVQNPGAAPTNAAANMGGAKDAMGRLAQNAATPLSFATNLVNAFRKPPAPIKGGLVKPVVLAKMDRSAERGAIDSATAGNNKFADRALDSQSAAAVRAANAGQAFAAKGQSYSQENAENTQINNTQAQINKSIDASNVAVQNKFNDDVIGMKIARQRESSANMANAADKAMAITNANAQRQLDREKFNTLSQMYKDSGVTDRLVRRMLGKDANAVLEDGDYSKALGQNAYGGRLKKVFASGGPIDPVKGTKSSTASAGPTPGPKPSYRPLSAQQITDWNKYLDFVKTKGLAGSKDLDDKAKGLGPKLMDEYRASNPNFSLDYSWVKDVQNEYSRSQADVQRLAAKQGKTGAYMQADTSVHDGWFGHRTSTQYLIPQETVLANGSVRQDGLLNANSIPTSQMKGGQRPVSGFTLPAGVKPINNQDGVPMLTKADGDVISVADYAKAQASGQQVELKRAMGGKLGGDMMPGLSQRMPHMRGRLRKISA